MAVTVLAEAIEGQAIRRSSRFSARIRPLLIGAVLLAILLVAAYVVPALSGSSPDEPGANPILAAPSGTHWFGTDSNGLDVFVRVAYAARIDLPAAAAGVGISFGLALVLGLGMLAMGRVASGVLGRVLDLLQAFPLLVLALVLVSLRGSGLSNVILALCFINTPIFLRLLRSRVVSVMTAQYIEAAIGLGNSRGRLVVRHVLRNSLAPMVVQIGISLGYGILTIAGLAFLGAGVQAPTAEWGSMILTGSADLVSGQWWTTVFPGIAVAVAVAGCNLVSEGLGNLVGVEAL